MPAQLRESSASIRWLTHPPEGVPRLVVDSHTFPAVPMSVNEAAPHPLATSPGELIAGAFGSVFAWMLAEGLMSEGTQALEIEVNTTLDAEVGSDGSADPALREVRCHAVVRFPGGDARRLQALCEAAMTRCARAVGLRDEIELRVDSTAITAEA
jgi:organic hydroperoxide reductase OsmC/OhrA